MADIQAALTEIKKAAGLLVNRFGHEADVFARLNAAIRHLESGTGDAVAAEPVLPVAGEAAVSPITESDGTAPSELAPENGPSNETTAARRKRK